MGLGRDAENPPLELSHALGLTIRVIVITYRWEKSGKLLLANARLAFLDKTYLDPRNNSCVLACLVALRPRPRHKRVFLPLQDQTTTLQQLFNNSPSATSCPTIANMGVQDVLSRKTGVIVGDDVLRLFEYAREHGFALPAIVRPCPP